MSISEMEKALSRLAALDIENDAPSEEECKSAFLQAKQALKEHHQKRGANPPAFPSQYESNGELVYFPGMTLRDYFAIRSFQVRLKKYSDWTLTELTEQAYADADAMLKAREK